MSQTSESNFSGPPPFITNSKNLRSVPIPPPQVQYGETVGYRFSSLPSMLPPPLPMPPLPPISLLPLSQFISPSPQFIPPAPSHTNCKQYNVEQPSQYYKMTQQDYFHSHHIEQSFTTQNKLGNKPVGIETDGNISKDQNWVHSWLNKIGKVSKVIEKKDTTSDVKIYEIKELLSAVISIIKELENASLTLNVMMKSVTNLEWEKKCQEIDKKKEELSQLLDALKMDPMKMIEIKNKLNKRKAKRGRLKRQSLKRKAEKKACKENSEKLHKKIDSWLEEMKKNVERNRREEKLKREADSVLWEVTQIKAESRKQINLLTSLLQLRNAKATALRSSGKCVSEGEITTFNTVIEKLKTMWELQLDGYLLEEQGLRMMLSEDVMKKNTFGVHVKQFLLEWEAAIFGSKCNETFGEPQNLEEFVTVRYAWDHFVANEKTVMASMIPVGWIVPSKPSDEIWAKHLKHAK